MDEILEMGQPCEACQNDRKTDRRFIIIPWICKNWACITKQKPSSSRTQVESSHILYSDRVSSPNQVMLEIGQNINFSLNLKVKNIKVNLRNH